MRRAVRARLPHPPPSLYSGTRRSEIGSAFAARPQFRKIRMPERITRLECFRKLQKHRLRFVCGSVALGANFVKYAFGSNYAFGSWSVNRIVAEETQRQCAPSSARAGWCAAVQHPRMKNKHVAGLDGPRNNFPS